MVGFAVVAGVAVGHASRRKVGFQAHNRRDARVRASAVKVQHAEHDAVIGDSQRRHVQFFRARDQLLDAALTIQ